ncbi:hypothetical protein, partial [uncultured Adlercreutzia sp.]|uniref:hypothetical protein n=1 Tax=uncultured Adlercreutzia sp. TaxID=875803 RepID=UPI0026F3BCEF
MYDLGIEVPTMFQMYSWKDMAEDMVGTLDSQNVYIQGYTDSNFETQRTINVETYNHLDSFRQAPLTLPAVSGGKWGNGDTILNNTADSYTLRRADRSLIFVSKMFYDAVSRSAYADVDSGEAVEENNDLEEKSVLEQAVGKKYEDGPDPSIEGVQFYRYNEDDVFDGYTAIAESDLENFLPVEPVTPEPGEDGTTPEPEPAPDPTPVWMKESDGSYTKVFLTTLDGAIAYRPADADESSNALSAAGRTFYTYDENAVSDGYSPVDENDLLTVQATDLLFKKVGNKYYEARVEADAEGN